MSTGPVGDTRPQQRQRRGSHKAAKQRRRNRVRRGASRLKTPSMRRRRSRTRRHGLAGHSNGCRLFAPLRGIFRPWHPRLSGRRCRQPRKTMLRIYFRDERRSRISKLKKNSSWQGLTLPTSRRASARRGDSRPLQTERHFVAQTRDGWVTGSRPVMTSFFKFELESGSRASAPGCDGDVMPEPYRPSNFASRFSKNAFTPSRTSWLGFDTITDNAASPND